MPNWSQYSDYLRTYDITESVCTSKRLSNVNIVRRKSDYRTFIAKKVPCINEILLLQRFENQHIIYLIQTFKTDCSYIMILPHFDSNLEQLLLNKQQPLLEHKVYDILRDLLKALTEVHSHNIIHRDVKTANILIDNHNHFVLCDFGNAKECDDIEGTYVGTRGFTAPEMMYVNGRYDTKADLYSLGMVVFHCLFFYETTSNTNYYFYGNSWSIDDINDIDLQLILEVLIQPNPYHRPTAANLLYKVDNILNNRTKRRPNPPLSKQEESIQIKTEQFDYQNKPLSDISTPCHNEAGIQILTSENDVEYEEAKSITTNKYDEEETQAKQSNQYKQIQHTDIVIEHSDYENKSRGSVPNVAIDNVVASEEANVTATNKTDKEETKCEYFIHSYFTDINKAKQLKKYKQGQNTQIITKQSDSQNNSHFNIPNTTVDDNTDISTPDLKQTAICIHKNENDIDYEEAKTAFKNKPDEEDINCQGVKKAKQSKKYSDESVTCDLSELFDNVRKRENNLQIVILDHTLSGNLNGKDMDRTLGTRSDLCMYCLQRTWSNEHAAECLWMPYNIQKQYL